MWAERRVCVSSIVLFCPNVLKKLADAALKRPSSDKISGRDQHLRFLAEMVAVTTGREHYAELAELTAAVRVGYTGEIVDATADNIGKLVRRMRRQEPRAPGR